MNYNKVIYILIGAAALLAFPLIYLILIPRSPTTLSPSVGEVLLPRGQTMLSPSHWLVFGALALLVVLAAVSPIIVHRVRRARGLPPEHVSASDLRFTLILIAVLCPLAFFAVTMFEAYGTLVIMLAPIACMIRFQRRSQPNPK